MQSDVALGGSSHSKCQTKSALNNRHQGRDAKSLRSGAIANGHEARHAVLFHTTRLLDGVRHRDP